jgi:subtilisin-like proprotein convertase family protein
MKKTTLLFCLLLNAALWAQTFTGSTGSINDEGLINDYTTTVSDLANPLNGDYGLIKVCVDISHTYDSDLNVHLIAPDGTEINLFSGLGGGGHDFTGTCLSQSAEFSINSSGSPFTGTFKPQETLGSFNAGQDGNGVWTLRILDTYPFADTGTVNSWSLEFGEDAAVPFVFTASNLPIVIINTNGQTIVDEPKIDAFMSIINNGEGMMNSVTDTPNEYNGNVGIELRGNYSQGLPQKPYKFETRDEEGEELNVSLLGMPEEHDWCLIANYNDKVFMRNTLAYDLFTQMGNYAARSQYCEVVLNGNYQGVYMLMESIKRDNDRVDIAKLEEDENDGLDITGGYILKSDYWTSEDSWELEYHPIAHPDRDVRLVYEYPKPDDITYDQKVYIQTFINDFETALYGDNFADPVNGYNKYIDVDSFIDYFIVNELSRNIDGFRKSFFFNKDKDESEDEISKLKAGPVWDFDWAWKDIWSCPIFEATDGSGWAHDINDCNPDVASPGWHIRLLEDPAFQNRLRCRWEDFRSTFLSDEAIDAYIDETAALLNDAQSRHFDRWGNLGINTGTPEVEQDPATFEAQIAQFKNWIDLRTAWLDSHIPGSAENCDAAANATFEKNTISIYPNPANEIVQISSDSLQQPDYAEFFDVTGKSVLKQKIAGNSPVIVSGLANGIYICRVSAEGTILKTVKIVVMH